MGLRHSVGAGHNDDVANFKHLNMFSEIERQGNVLAELCRLNGARRLDAFGSMTRPEFNPDRSDLDFLVEFDDMPPHQHADAYFNLKEGLESLFGRRVDLINVNSITNPFFRARVVAERRVVYER